MNRTYDRIKAAVETEFVSLARNAFGDKLVSLTLYGSYLRDTFSPGVSDVNMLVILSENNPASLAALGRDGRRLMRKNRITPLILSRREFVTSADVFPMEYMDIVDSHRVIMGPDVTSELEIDLSNLRHQIEHQLRGNLVSLRQLAVAAAKPRLFGETLLRRELAQWYGRLAAVLRGLLRLKGVAIPSEPEDIVGAANVAFGFESGPIMDLLGMRTRAGKADGPTGRELLDNLLVRLTDLVTVVDSMGDGSSGGAT